MDAAARAELDRLRRRAYGPAPDIDDDALLRLIELEELARLEHDAPVAVAAPGVDRREAEPVVASAGRPERRPAARVGHPVAAGGASSAQHPEPALAESTPPAPPAPPASGSVPTASRAPGTVHRPRHGRTALIAVGVAVIAGLSAVALLRSLTPAETAPGTRTALSQAFRDSRAAYSFARDTDAVGLLEIPLDGSFGNYIDLPSDGYVPEFPTAGEVEWASHVGEYFGWDVWIAGAMADTAGLRRDHCIVIERNALSRGRCVPADIRSQSALLVAVPFDYISSDERPVGMAEGQRLGFWWHHDRSVTVLLGDDPTR